MINLKAYGDPARVITSAGVSVPLGPTVRLQWLGDGALIQVSLDVADARQLMAELLEAIAAAEGPAL